VLSFSENSLICSSKFFVVTETIVLTLEREEAVNGETNEHSNTNRNGRSQTKNQLHEQGQGIYAQPYHPQNKHAPEL
jgi:hypothetical protein